LSQAACSYAEQDLSDQLWQELESDDGDDSAAREHLAAGFPIYYCDATTPSGLQIKKHPDGRRELVRFRRDGDEIIRLL